jgi:hypothetical protein
MFRVLGPSKGGKRLSKKQAEVGATSFSEDHSDVSFVLLQA